MKFQFILLLLVCVVNIHCMQSDSESEPEDNTIMQQVEQKVGFGSKTQIINSFKDNQQSDIFKTRQVISSFKFNNHL